MADINVKRFVDINIVANPVTTSSGIRDTIVLFTPEGTLGQDVVIETLAAAQARYSVQSAPITRQYLTVFFNNGGVKCRVIEGKDIGDVTGDAIKALANEYILIAFAASNEIVTVEEEEMKKVELAYSVLKNIAISRAADTTIYGINEKIILARSEDFSDITSVENFAVKYSTVVGAEMTMAAYLSRIDVYRSNSVEDYAFTQETLVAENVTDTDYETLTNNGYNVDIVFAGATRNMNGNMKDRLDLVNNFVRIILHQTLTSKLSLLLAQKLKNNSSISRIYSTIAQELEEYNKCGYLTGDKVWTDDDLIYTYNQQQYVIVTSGTPLTSGYLIKVLPFTALTAEDKQAHKAPPIYIIIADQYGIRQITIQGEVL